MLDVRYQTLDLKDFMKYYKKLFLGFWYAFKGIVYTVGHERNMRVHLVCMAYMYYYLFRYDFFTVTRTQLAVLLLANGLVVAAELFNTAVERTVDAAIPERNPVAGHAKDAAAGAVLIATGTAVLVGCLLFLGDHTFSRLSGMRVQGPDSLMKVLLAGIILLVLVTIIKVLGSRGKLLKGGICSGHAAAGFFLASTILYFSKDALAAIVGVIMALLIAQSRVEAKIHSIQEVVTGALLAMLLTAFVYWFLPT